MAKILYSPAPVHRVEGTTFPIAFIGVPDRHFMVFLNVLCNSHPNHPFAVGADKHGSLIRGGASMIELTRLNGNPMILNSDLIKIAEASPDTMLTLINGEKLIVREELGDVIERVVAYRARLLSTVARRLSSFDELQRIASSASLDVSGQVTQGSATDSPHIESDASK